MSADAEANDKREDKPAEQGPKRVKREAVPDGVCRACWNTSRGKAAGVGHLYRPPCAKPAPTRGKASGRGAIRIGLSVGSQPDGQALPVGGQPDGHALVPLADQPAV